MKDKHKLSKNPTKFTLLCLQNENSIEKRSESAIVRVTIPHIIFLTSSFHYKPFWKMNGLHNNPQPSVVFAEPDLRSGSLLLRYPT